MLNKKVVKFKRMAEQRLPFSYFYNTPDAPMPRCDNHMSMLIRYISKMRINLATNASR